MKYCPKCGKIFGKGSTAIKNDDNKECCNSCYPEYIILNNIRILIDHLEKEDKSNEPWIKKRDRILKGLSSEVIKSIIKEQDA